jgi:hypothetical protein
MNTLSSTSQGLSDTFILYEHTRANCADGALSSITRVRPATPTTGNKTADNVIRQRERDALLKEALELCGNDVDCTLVTLSADDKDEDIEVLVLALCS